MSNIWNDINEAMQAEPEEQKVKEGGTSGGSVAGFQIPMGIKQRKAKVDEMLAKHPDINEANVLAYWHGMDDKQIDPDCSALDQGKVDEVADRIREHGARMVVRNKMKEVVRKKPGGGGYVLYSPNQGKKKPSKGVGTFPTKVGAKKAELARFPPKDPGKLKRLRKEVDKLMKDPKKRAEKEKAASKEKGAAAPAKKKFKEPKKESVEDFKESLKHSIVNMLKEGLFHEEKTGSDWDDVIGRLSKTAMSGDSKLQNLQKGITKKSQKVLEDAFNAISKNIDKKKIKLKNHGVKQQETKTYLAFSATMNNVECGPIAIYIEGSTPKIELSDQAKVALTKTEPAVAKLFRAELVMVQERVLDKMDELQRAVIARDKYLSSMEDEVDGYVADLTPLQVSLLKQLLTKKYRKN